MASSPRLSRYRSEGTDESKDAFGNSSTRRSTGLMSEYTSKRLEELRLRRAESESSYADYKARREAREKEKIAFSESDTSGYTRNTINSATGGDIKQSASGNSLGAPLACTEEDPEERIHTSASASSFTDMRTRRDQREKSGLVGQTPVSSSSVGSLSSPNPSLRENGATSPSPTSRPSTAITSTTTKSTRRTDARQELDSSCSILRDSYSKSKEDDECVGFATLPEQIHRKAVKRGFDFTLLVVGETGLGKSTMINSLLLTDLYKERKISSVEERVTKTVNIEKNTMEIEEKGVKLRLTIVDTPGYNDAVDSEQCPSWKPIEDYIDQQFDQFYKDETGLNRKNIKDNRVHCCLFFISPYGRGLKQVDVQFMKRLHDKINIVPVIAKADTLTKPEIKALKERVLDQIDENHIKIYEFPECDSDEDEEFKKQDLDLKARRKHFEEASIPFAVIGSNAVVEVNGKKVRGRLYPWGIVEVDNPDHCDFGKLRQMLISTHMQDLKEVTRDIHYEAFRAKRVQEQMRKQNRERNTDHRNASSNNRHRKKHYKLKRDSSPNFEAIMDADKLLQEKDAEIRKMQEMLAMMQQQLANQSSPGKNPQVNGSINGIGAAH